MAYRSGEHTRLKQKMDKSSVQAVRSCAVGRCRSARRPVGSEVSVIALGADYVDLSWPAAMDDVGVSTYRLRLGSRTWVVMAVTRPRSA